jgi:hypothetical protein
LGAYTKTTALGPDGNPTGGSPWTATPYTGFNPLEDPRFAAYGRTPKPVNSSPNTVIEDFVTSQKNDFAATHPISPSKPPTWSDPNIQTPEWVTPEWKSSHPLGVGVANPNDHGNLNAFYSFTDRSPKDFKKLSKWFGGEQGAMDWLTPLAAPGGSTRF